LEMKLKGYDWIGLLKVLRRKACRGLRLRGTFQAERSERYRCAIAPSRSGARKGGSGERNSRGLVELEELNLDGRDGKWPE
jgi:hypothetical protein